MVHARANAQELTVFYRAKEHYIVTGIFAAFALVTGFVTLVTLQDPRAGTAGFAATLLLLATCALAAVAVLSFLNGWRRNRNPKWLLRFAPGDVRVNTVHPGYLRTAPALADAPLVIPVAAIKWIRRTTKPRLWDEDRDEVYVEMRLSDQAFQSASAHRSGQRKAREGVSSSDDETILRLFEGNVIRVLIEGDRWPEEISAYWHDQRYPVAAPFTIEEPVDVDSAKAQPRELF